MGRRPISRALAVLFGDCGWGLPRRACTRPSHAAPSFLPPPIVRLLTNRRQYAAESNVVVHSVERFIYPARSTVRIDAECA